MSGTAPRGVSQDQTDRTERQRCAGPPLPGGAPSVVCRAAPPESNSGPAERVSEPTGLRYSLSP